MGKAQAVLIADAQAGGCRGGIKVRKYMWGRVSNVLGGILRRKQAKIPEICWFFMPPNVVLAAIFPDFCTSRVLRGVFRCGFEDVFRNFRWSLKLWRGGGCPRKVRFWHFHGRFSPNFPEKLPGSRFWGSISVSPEAWESAMKTKNIPEGIEWKAYEAARQGFRTPAIAARVGVGVNTFRKMLKQVPAVSQAVEAGRAARGSMKSTLTDHVLGRLPPECRELWAKVAPVAEDSTPPAQQRQEAVSLIAEAPDLYQMHIFLHCLMRTHWIVGEAARRCGIARWKVEQWMQDPAFAKLLEEVESAKDDFFEGCLIELCRSGDSPAIIFANKSRNRKRGYAEKVESVTEHKVEVRHQVNVESLDGVPIEARQALLEAIRRRKEGGSGDLPALPAPKTGPAAGSIMEAEFTERPSLPPAGSRWEGKVEVLERAKA